MTNRENPHRKGKVLEALNEWSREHNPLDIPNLARKNPRLFCDLIEVGIPDTGDPLLRTAVRLARQTFRITRRNKGLSKYYEAKKTSRVRQTAKDITAKRIPDSKRWMMEGVPVGQQVVRRILGHLTDTPTEEDAYNRVMNLLKSNYLSIPELLKKTGLEKSEAESILSEIKSKGILGTKRKGSVSKFNIPPRRPRSTQRRKK
jgi:hypothetical protein